VAQAAAGPAGSKISERSKVLLAWSRQAGLDLTGENMWYCTGGDSPY
jgi:hypothetical protein